MPLWLVPLSLTGMSLAAEPARAGVPDPAGPPPVSLDLVLSWSEVGLRPAAPESPAIGPELLALGPDDAAAVYDPLRRQVVVVGGRPFRVPGADGLAFTSAGILLVMDGSARSLRTYDTDGTLLDEQAFPSIVPPGGSLAVDEPLVLAIDPFGNGHPLALVTMAGSLSPPQGASLVPPARRVVRSGTSLVVDGETIATFEGRGGGRLLGDWLLVEAVNDGAVSRMAISLEGRVTVSLPVGGRMYAPMQDVAVGPDGGIGWLDPQADGLHLVRVFR
ncbi:MAG: hypothetical protein Q8P18_26610 [Pseudomonadota bacterium]|nr:hypothetical protein [Pseudomonadota bacterium]